MLLSSPSAARRLTIGQGALPGVHSQHRDDEQVVEQLLEPDFLLGDSLSILLLDYIDERVCDEAFGVRVVREVPTEGPQIRTAVKFEYEFEWSERASVRAGPRSIQPACRVTVSGSDRQALGLCGCETWLTRNSTYTFMVDSKPSQLCCVGRRDASTCERALRGCTCWPAVVVFELVVTMEEVLRYRRYAPSR